jgi:hypothetical protein
MKRNGGILPRINTAVQILLFLATAGAFWAAAHYAHIASLTLDQIKSQTTSIKTGADAAKTSADAARDAVKEAQNARIDNNASASNILGEMKKQSSAMDKYARAAEQQARATRDAAKTTKETLELTEAADIEIDHISCSPEGAHLSRDSSVIIFLKNVGKTRAEQVQAKFVLGVPSSRPPVNHGPFIPEPFVMPSGIPYPSHALNVRDSANEGDWQNIIQGVFQLHLFGHAAYRDIFGNHHCYMWDAVYQPNSACSFDIMKIDNMSDCGSDYY